MNILIAPDSFKGTLTSAEVCDIIGRAFEDRINDVKITKLPVADGGEGLCSCMYDIAGGTFREAQVRGVFGEKMTAGYLMLPDGTAVVETASCAGLPLAGDRKNPETATTYGVGELIADAVSNGASGILLGLGGSATNDCGTGMAAALGFRFLGRDGSEVFPLGGNLSEISRIIPPSDRISVPVTAACDVENPLYGENGAAYVFAPQKGADSEMVRRLDTGLRNISGVIKECLGIVVSELPGGGAAGGLGAGAFVFLGAELKKGIDIILDIADFDSAVKDTDLVITGEGRLDFQSLNGKVISGVAERSVRAGKTVITVCGCEGAGADSAKDLGISECYYSCSEPKTFDEIVRTCREDLYKAASEAAEEFLNMR